MSEIQRFSFIASSAQYYQSALSLMTQIHDKFVELGFTCTNPTDQYGTGTESTFSVHIDTNLNLYLVCNASTNHTGFRVKLRDDSDNDLSATFEHNSFVDATHTSIFLNIVMTDASILVGFSDFNESTYKFDFAINEYLGDTYWMYVPWTDGGNTRLDMYSGDTVVYKLKTLLNISVDDYTKGIFHSFYATDVRDFTDVLHNVTDFYNINTGYVFNVCQPVYINEILFIPLNTYTVFKVGSGIV